MTASYPAEVARRLGLPTDWAELLADAGGKGMPELKELTNGLDAMLE